MLRACPRKQRAQKEDNMWMVIYRLYETLLAAVMQARGSTKVEAAEYLKEALDRDIRHEQERCAWREHEEAAHAAE
jgi:hypothetical protein